MKNKFRYKSWANTEILDAVAGISQIDHPEQWTLAVRLMNHTYVVDRIFAAHLTRAEHNFDATNTPETPTIDQLRQKVSESDAWYERYVGDLDDTALRETICFTFTDVTAAR